VQAPVSVQIAQPPPDSYLAAKMEREHQLLLKKQEVLDKLISQKMNKEALQTRKQRQAREEKEKKSSQALEERRLEQMKQKEEFFKMKRQFQKEK